ncbi:hypothetical protein EDB83DRAFT_2218934, partial [Lactarius deliciosus]
SFPRLSALFQPVSGLPTFGASASRVVMAFLTRLRTNRGHIHGELSRTYYAQRSSVPGTFIISLATCP